MVEQAGSDFVMHVKGEAFGLALLGDRGLQEMLGLDACTQLLGKVNPENVHCDIVLAVKMVVKRVSVNPKRLDELRDVNVVQR